MKKYLVPILVCFLLPVEICCQSWFPIGAEWYFDFVIPLNYPNHGFTKYLVVYK